MTMEQVSYSHRQLVFGILKTLVVRASQNNLDLTYDVDPEIPDQLIGDSLRLRQVITNLVGNAIKFTPSKMSRKGHVALTCRLVSIQDATVTLEFCVSDTGIGIAKDKLTMIFDTFAQADGSTTRVRLLTRMLQPVSIDTPRVDRSTVALAWDYRFRSVSSASCKATCGWKVKYPRGASSTSPSLPNSASRRWNKRSRRCHRLQTAASYSSTHYSTPPVWWKGSRNLVSDRTLYTRSRKWPISRLAPISIP
jgi:hypothetical protein